MPRPSPQTAAPEPEEPPPYRSCLPPEICIYADQASDFQRASELLLKLGAVPEPMLSAETVERLNRWTTWRAIIAAVVIVLFVWERRWEQLGGKAENQLNASAASAMAAPRALSMHGIAVTREHVGVLDQTMMVKPAPSWGAAGVSQRDSRCPRAG